MIDWTAIGFLLLGYLGGAIMHTTIAYRMIQKEADRSRTHYLQLLRETLLPPIVHEILNGVGTKVEGLVGSEKASVEAAVAALPIATELESFLRSDAGKQWAVELSGTIAQDFTDQMVQRTTSAAGAVARTAQQEIFRAIDGAMDFGNPILNGIWASIPRDNKVRVYNTLARTLRRAGMVLVPMNGGEGAEVLQIFDADAQEVTETVDSGTLALYGG